MQNYKGKVCVNVWLKNGRTEGEVAVSNEKYQRVNGSF